MTRVLSGIKPSGEVTLGNYLGAMKRWADEQTGRENFYFVPNLHALTVRIEPRDLRQWTYSAVAWLLTMGVDLKHSLIYAQSQIAAHSELCWILNNYATMGELSRMTQFKDKSQKLGPEGQLVGLFDYPVLMAADILLYDADEVPVGRDQIQHVELTRNIAERFNNLYGATFKLPVATVADVGARIMDLQDPQHKMSKSDDDKGGIVMMGDAPKVIEAKVLRAVTDSDNEIRASQDKPALTNLLNIYSLLVGMPIKQIEARYKGVGYGVFKKDLAAIMVDHIVPLQRRYQELMGETDELDRVLEHGRRRVVRLADAKLSQVKQRIGLL